MNRFPESTSQAIYLRSYHLEAVIRAESSTQTSVNQVKLYIVDPCHTPDFIIEFQRRLVDFFRQHEPPPRVAKGVGQHGNGVADSLPSGSGNLDVHLGRQRLPLAHPLQPHETVRDPIDLTAQVCLVAHQAIRDLLAWNDRGRLFAQHPFPVNSRPPASWELLVTNN